MAVKMSSPSYLAQEVKELFTMHDMQDFDPWWELDIPLVDALNHRGSGWSGVAFASLQNKAGQATSFYIKRQENYNQRTWNHPVLGVPTFQKEFENIQIVTNLGVPTLTPLYFAARRCAGKCQSILITQALLRYESLVGLRDRLSEEEQNRVMARCGEVARQLNDAGYIHDCLYPKHLFYKMTAGAVDVRLIDIEKLKWRPWRQRLMYTEIARFIRRRGGLSDHNLHCFLEAYLTSGQQDLSSGTLAQKLLSMV